MNPSLNSEKRRATLDTRPFTLEAMLSELQLATTLEVVGKDPAGAGMTQRVAGSESTYLFGFAKEFLPLTARDKEVLFVLRTARVSVRAKFQLKDMLYHGSLAV
jgi:hypothetical protein